MDYRSLMLHLRVGQKIGRRQILKALVGIQYRRNDYEFERGTFRVRGDTVEIFPAYEEQAIRVELWGDDIERITIPFELESWFGRHIGTRLVSFALIRVLNTSNPIGRKVRPKMLHKAAPLVRIRPKELAGVGVERASRITAVENGRPVTADGNALEVENVIWCTGYKPGFDWIDLPVFDELGQPRHRRGISEDVPSLYFLGLFFLHAVWSETLPGLQPDVRHIIKHLAGRTSASLAV